MPCTYDPASRITAITQHLWASVTTGGSTTLATTPLHWQIGYDSRSRLSSFARQGAETRYTYDANSNRLLGMQQTITRQRDGRTRSTASTTVNYAIDANGTLVSDGLRTFEYDEANRLAKVRITRDGEAASVRYLSNAMSQRVFKGEPTSDAALPDEQELGEGFIAWLRKNFRWMFERAQASTSIGTAYLYADGDLPQWALLGEYDNGSAAAKGRSEYIWLPTSDGAIPIGMLRNGQFYAIHTDHLGTSRLMTNAENKPVWQWPYSAFGNNKPTGVLQATANPRAAITTQPMLLRATNPQQALDFRFPGQHFDDATQMADNIHRTYWMLHGRYTQSDFIGLRGGWNRFAYADNNSLSLIDPQGLMGHGGGGTNRAPAPKKTPAGAQAQFGAGGMVHTPLGIGLGADSGFAIDTCGNVCFYGNVCYTVGPGMAAGLGLQGGLGSGLASSGVTTQHGISWVGGAGLMGQGTVNVSTDGEAGVNRGMAGVGGGAALVYQQCRQVMICRKN